MAYRETGATRRRKQARRENLLFSAESLVREGGFKSLTVQQLAAAAELSVGSVYRYFENKEAMAVEVFRHATERELTALDSVMASHQHPLLAIHAGITAFCERAMQAPQFARALIAEPVEAGVDRARLHYRRKYTELFETRIIQALNQGDLPPQISSVSAAAVVGALAESLLGPLGHDADDAALANHLAEFCLRALGAKTGIGICRS